MSILLQKTSETKINGQKQYINLVYKGNNKPN